MSGYRCWVCLDKGQLRLTPDTIVDCAFCPPPDPAARRRGWVRCGSCHGAGRVTERHMAHGGGEMVSVYHCDMCSGSGRIEL